MMLKQTRLANKLALKWFSKSCTKTKTFVNAALYDMPEYIRLANRLTLAGHVASVTESVSS